jgi:tripartite-type tricarboxylate transporter receptor subunit TctC
MFQSHGEGARSVAGPGSHLSRREFIALGIAPAVTSNAAFAEEYPSKTIRFMAGATPGGSIDYGARVVAMPLSETLKAPVIVENKPGAAGVIATEFVARSPGDGYTLLIGTPSPIIIAPQAMPTVKINPLTGLIAINTVSTTPLAIAVNPGLEVKSLKDLVALSRKRPVRMGLPLAGSVSHLVVEMTAGATGCNFLNVPYKGAAPALTDAIAGHIDATVADVGVFLEMHKEGKLRIVMVTSEKRVEALPDVPTANEDAPGLVVMDWLGVFAPANTPPLIVDRINAALIKVVARDDVRAAFQRASATASTMAGPEQFQKYVAAEYLRYGRLVRERNIVIGSLRRLVDSPPVMAEG